jgi:metallo-beta-lactamase class B
MRYVAAFMLCLPAVMAAQNPVQNRPKNPAFSDEARAGLHGASSQSIEPFKLVGNIYYVGAQNIAASLITTPEGHILIDTGTIEMAPIVAANIQKLGFKLQDVKIILSTQAHFDHVGATAALKKQTGAKLMIMAPDVKALESGQDLSPLADEGWAPVTVDRALETNDTVKLGGVTLRAIWSPGHTPGSTTWLTTVQENGTSYEVAFLAGLGPNNGVQLIGNPQHPKLVEQTLGMYKTLKALNPDIYIPGHPQQLFMGKLDRLRAGERPHPLADKAAYKKMIEDSEAGFIKRVEAEKAKGAAKP